MTSQVVRPKTLAARVWSSALDLVFPPRCVGCDDFGAFLCRECIAGMTRAQPPRCSACWMPGPAKVCRRCRVSEPSFASARSALVYEGAARKAVLALKFRGVSALAGLMAEEMARSFEAWNPPIDAIVPVPLAGARRRSRGYDQAKLLAEEVAMRAGLPLHPKALARRRATRAQALESTEESRRANVAGAFVLGSKPISGNILLIDDVMTTGATLDECAHVLLQGGAEAVYALTFARED